MAPQVTALTARTNILPSLRAILTNPMIIKVGHTVEQALQVICDTFALSNLANLLKAKDAPILDLGKYSKLKGATNDPLLSLHALAGIVLQQSFSPSAALSSSLAHQTCYFDEIDCQWQIFLSLHRRDSIGLPLQPIQAKTHGQLVTLVQGCKPVAEGSIVGHHPGYIDAATDEFGGKKRINVSPSRSLITISKVSHHGLTQPSFKSDFRFWSRGPYTHCINRLSNGFSTMVQMLW